MTTLPRTQIAALLMLSSMLSPAGVIAQKASATTGGRGRVSPTPSDGSKVAAGSGQTPSANSKSAVPSTAAESDDMLKPLTLGEDDDMLKPLTPGEDDDMLKPLTPGEDDDMLKPLTPGEDDDMLEPLKPADDATSKSEKPVNLNVAEYERQLEEAERERARRQAETKKDGLRTILVERWYTDPCGSFSVSWGGRKTCEETKRRKWELIDVNDDSKLSKQPAPVINSTPSSRPASFPTGASGTGASASRGSAGASSGPSASPGGGSPPTDGDASPNASHNDNRSITGAPARVAGPSDKNGFRGTGPFAVRVDEVKPTADGGIDMLTTLTTRTTALILVRNGDWRAFATDTDGVSIDTIAMYRPTEGARQPFDRMPHVSAAAPAQIRFHFTLPEGMAAIRTVSIAFADAPPATFAVTQIGRDEAPPISGSAGAAATLKRFEVRYETLTKVGQTTELTFAARNITDQVQYADGTRLQFTAARRNGSPVESTGRVYPFRGAIGHHLDGISVLPGQSARFRVVFDVPDAHGPIAVRDDTTKGVPSLPAAPEPVW